jgi:hypothetical protein
MARSVLCLKTPAHQGLASARVLDVVEIFLSAAAEAGSPDIKLDCTARGMSSAAGENGMMPAGSLHTLTIRSI